GQTLLLYQLPHIKAPRILLVGCGKQKPLNQGEFHKVIASSIRALNTVKAKHAIVCLTELNVEKYDLAWKIKHTVEVISDVLYRFDEFKSKKQPKHTLQEVTLQIAGKHATTACDLALKQGTAIADGMTYTKNLANLPSNVCNPAYLAQAAKALAK